MIGILFLALVGAEQFSIVDLLKNKDARKAELLNKISSWLSTSDKEKVVETEESVLMDALIQELEKEQDEIPIEWVEMETSGPTRILRINKPSKQLIKQLQTFYFDIWHLSREYVDVMVEYEQFTLVGDLITELSPSSVFQVLVTDVDEMILELGQSPSEYKESDVVSFDPETWFNDYHPYEAIMKLFENWTLEHEDVMTMEPMGFSFEKREINAFHIKPFPEYQGERKRIYIQSLVHAREWVGGSTLQYIVYNILKKKNNKEWKDIEFIFNPVANPDGYTHTWGQNRLWRKNRKPVGDDFGVDINRNFDANWRQGIEEAPGLADPKSEIYCGEKAESESETKAIVEYVKKLGGVHVFLTLHSYSQLILRPPCSTNEPTIWEKKLKDIGNDLRQSIRSVYNKQYTSQTAYDLYFTSGTSVEWVFNQKWNNNNGTYFRAIPYVIELRPRPSFFGYGFLLPASQIKPTGEEIWTAIKDVLVNEAKAGGLVEDKDGNAQK